MANLTAPQDQEHRSSAAGDQFRALVVASEPSVRRVIVGELAKAGYFVAEADDGTTGLLRAFHTQPAIIVVHSRLPSMSAAEFCRRLREAGSSENAYVLMTLAPDEEEASVEAFEAGVDDFLTHPLHPWALMSRVRDGERTREARSRQPAMESRPKVHTVPELYPQPFSALLVAANSPRS